MCIYSSSINRAGSSSDGSSTRDNIQPFQWNVFKFQPGVFQFADVWVYQKRFEELIYPANIKWDVGQAGEFGLFCRGSERGRAAPRRQRTKYGIVASNARLSAGSSSILHGIDPSQSARRSDVLSMWGCGWGGRRCGGKVCGVDCVIK